MATPILALIPSGYKSVKVYSVIPSNGDGDFTFTREGASGQPNSTRVNKDGLIEEVNSNVPRLDYSDGSCPSLLLENQSTNLLPYSEDFTQWTKLIDGTGVNPVVVSNEVISPDGTQNADKITFIRTSTGVYDYTLLKKDYGGSDINATASIYLKSDANVNIEITSDDINYKTITVTTDWKRFEVSDATSDRLTFGLRGSEPSTLNATVYAWGGQLEQGSYATSYIPTNGAIATRLVDQASNDFSSQPTVANTSTVVLKFIPMGFDVDFNKLLIFSDGTNDVRLQGFQTDRYDVYGDGLTSSGMIDGVLQLDAGSINTISFSYSGTSLRFSHNGSTIPTLTTTGNLPTITEISHTTEDVLSPIKILKLEVYNDFKTQEELNSLTNSN